MKRFISTKFLRTLREASQTGIDKDIDVMQNEYDDFANSVFSEGSAKTDKNAYRNALVYTREEISGVTVVAGKKCGNPSQKSHCVFG